MTASTVGRAEGPEWPRRWCGAGICRLRAVGSQIEEAIRPVPGELDRSSRPDSITRVQPATHATRYASEVVDESHDLAILGAPPPRRGAARSSHPEGQRVGDRPPPPPDLHQERRASSRRSAPPSASTACARTIEQRVGRVGKEVTNVASFEAAYGVLRDRLQLTERQRHDQLTAADAP